MRYLLLIDTEGNILLGDVDSGARIPVGGPLDHTSGARVTTAVWSPAGRWTAWSVASIDPDGINHLCVHDEATNDTNVLAESLHAFYGL